jgi:hypothetical protein
MMIMKKALLFITALTIISLIAGSCSEGNEIKQRPVTSPATTSVPSLTPPIFPLASLEVEWTKEIKTGNPAGVLAMVNDTPGNFFVIYSNSLKIMGDAFISKYDTEFKMLWMKRGNTSMGSLFPLALACDDQAVYVSGFLLGGNSGLQTYLTKYASADGSEKWTRLFTTGGTEGACFVTIDSGYVYIAGEKYTYSKSPPPKIESFVRKLDSAGKDIWVIEMLPFFEPKAIAVVTEAIYVAGSVRGGYSDRLQGQNAFVVKYDLYGKEIWLREFGPGRVDALTTDANGVYTIGFLSRSDQVTKGGYYLRKFTPSGDEVWTRIQLPFTPYNVRLYGGEVYVIGGGVLPGWKNYGGKDSILRKYDNKGREVWDFFFGTDRDEEARDIAFDRGLLNTYILGEASGPQTRVPVPFNAYMSKYRQKKTR